MQELDSKQKQLITTSAIIILIAGLIASLLFLNSFLAEKLGLLQNAAQQNASRILRIENALTQLDQQMQANQKAQPAAPTTPAAPAKK